MACLWTAVIQYPDLLIKRVQSFEPSVDKFYEYKSFLQERKFPGGHEHTVEIGFKNLAIHRLSYSGLGTMAGGPLGGKHQASSEGIDSRWNPGRLVKDIEKLHALLSAKSRYCCSSFDFQRMIEYPWAKSLLYIDPPYYQMGNGLYHCGLTEQDHQRLADTLRKTSHLWLLSYDDCPEIRELYEWATIQEIEGPYSIAGATRKTELLIYPHAE